MILIAGCGYLGSYLIDALREITDEPILAASRRPHKLVEAKDLMYATLDVTDDESVWALAETAGGEARTVFYFAAFHNIDALVGDPAAGARVNLEGLRRFLSAFPETERLFFSSTDCVYGENTAAFPAFPESAPLAPVNEYGRQKALAEEIVHAAGFTAVRCGYMLGPSRTEKPHFYDRIVRSLQNGEETEMIDGMTRSVLSYRQAARCFAGLFRLSPEALPQTVNLGGDEGLTKYEMGCRIADRIGAPRSLIRRITFDEGKKFFTDARADSAVLDNRLLKSLLGLTELRWEGAP